MDSSTGAKVPVSAETTQIVACETVSVAARCKTNFWERIPTPSKTPPMLIIPSKKHKPMKFVKPEHTHNEILMLQHINDQQKLEIRALRQKLNEEEMLRAKEQEKSQETIKTLLEKLEVEMVESQRLSSQRKRAKTKLESAMKEYESD